MSIRQRRAWPSTLLIAALVGLAVSLYAYLVPLTGVTGTAGALLVTVSSLLLVVAGILLLMMRTGWVARLLGILAIAGSTGTLIAGFFLHEIWLMVAMTVACMAAIADLASKKESGHA